MHLGHLDEVASSDRTVNARQEVLFLDAEQIHSQFAIIHLRATIRKHLKIFVHWRNLQLFLFSFHKPVTVINSTLPAEGFN